MSFHALILLAGLAPLSTPQSIDAFDYRDSDAAQAVWSAHAESGQSSPVTVLQDNGSQVIQLEAPFASQPELGRVYIDRKVDLNLAGAGEFTLHVQSSSPEKTGRLSLYFRSGEGWYSGGNALTGAGWNHLRFSKASFRTEGKPAGWHRIDAIRIAVWRGSSVNGTLRFKNLDAVEHDVALVIPGIGNHPEAKSARQTAENVANMLAELGLGSDAVEDTALSHGALGKRRIAILAYNPGLPADSVQSLVQFLEQGGKVVACYTLPGRLAEALGFARARYLKQTWPGQFAEIRFADDDVPGLPVSVRQASWSILTATPAGFQAKVIGQWYDEHGKTAGEPAMLLSDRGAYFSHIILPDDRPGKKRMLAAILGRLDASLWEQMARHELDQVGRVGHLDSLADLTSFLQASDNDTVKQRLSAANEQLNAAETELNRQAYAKVVELAGDAREQLVQAYLMAQPSRSREGRAIWNHSGTGAYDGDWDRTAKELAAAGFNMILPNMLWGGRAHYASDVLPRSKTYEQYGDQISQCVEAAHKYGLEVHVWKVNFNLSGAPQEFVQKIRSEKRNQVSFDGQSHDWLCPSHPDNFALELASMLEVARRYPGVDGLHFDYIRYPGRDKCYCNGCRHRFETAIQRTVNRWPEDCYSGELSDQYAQWRCDQITRLVKAVHDEAKTLRPDLKLSAAVFRSYPNCRETVAQDWPQWVKAGYLDFICPMDYTQSDPDFIGTVRNQLDLIGDRIPVYPGIGQFRLSDDRTVGQIHHARALGADGFTIFNLDRGSAGTAVPAIGLGVGREQAQPPHRVNSLP